MSTDKTSDAVDLAKLEEDLNQIETVADCMRVGGYALATPLAQAHEAQAQREAIRTAKRKGNSHPEAIRRRAYAVRATERYTLFHEERERARVQRPDVSDPKLGAVCRPAQRGRKPRRASGR